MKVTQKTQDWGNSTGIRLPKKVLQAAKWHPDQVVAINVSGSSVVLTPVRATTGKLPTIVELLKGVTPEKIQGEIDWGSDRGKEKIDG